MPSASQDQMLHHLKQWADRTGYQFGPIEDTGNDFILEVTESNSFPSVQFIHQRKDHPHLLVVGQVKVPSEDRELLRRTTGEGFKRFIWDLKLSLLDKGVDFIVIGEDDGDPDAWEVHLRIFVKEFDPNLLQSSYTKVKNSLISVIWSYKRALDQAAMFTAGSSDAFADPGGVTGMDAADGPGRARRIMNVLANTGIIMTVALMDGFAQAMVGAVKGMTEALGEEGATDQAAEDIGQEAPGAREQVMGMISELREQLYAQMAEKAEQISPLLADRIFDNGPVIVEVYEFGLPRLTEELDEATIAEYAKLLVQEDKHFTEMFGELTAWMNGLPQLPK